MLPDLNRLKLLLDRLRELELRMPAPHERPILEIGTLALRDEVTRLAHALHDNSYWQHTAERDQRHAS